MKIYICKICNKVVEDGDKTIIIQSGSLVLSQNCIDPPNEEQCAFVFHDDCFLSVAGKEFHPTLSKQI